MEGEEITPEQAAALDRARVVDQTAPGAGEFVQIQGPAVGLRRQTVTHKRFKRLVDQWIDPSIEHSRPTSQIAEPKAT